MKFLAMIFGWAGGLLAGYQYGLIVGIQKVVLEGSTGLTEVRTDAALTMLLVFVFFGVASVFILEQKD